MSRFEPTRRHILKSTAAVAGSLSAWSAQAQEPTASDIRIGQSVHLSGPLAPTLVPPLKGQQLAVDEINRKGGIGGRPLRIIMLDDAYDAKRAVENTRKLIEDEKVVALFGYANTAAIGGSLPIALEKKVPLIGPYAGSPSLREKFHPYFFTSFASYRDEVVQMIRVLVSSRKTQLAVIYQNHPFGQLMLPVVESVAKELGATIVGKASLETNGSDAQAAAASLAPSKPEAVMLMAFGPATVPVVRAIRANMAVPIYALSIANAKSLVEALGDDGRGIAFTQTIPYPWRPVSPIIRDFTAVMAKANIPLDYDHFIGYLNVRVLIEGLKRAAIGGRAVTSASLTTGMESIGKIDLGGYPLNFSPRNHHGSAFVDITVLGPRGRYMR